MRRAFFINNGHLAGNDNYRGSKSLIGSKDKIEAKHSKKALRWAYKQEHESIEHLQDL